MTHGAPSNRLKPVFLVPVFVLCFALAGCRCDEEDPTVTVVNNTSGTVWVHVETSDGNSLDFGDVQGGVTSAEQVIPPGTTTLALVWGDIPVPYYDELQAEYCYDYDIRFDGDTVRVVPHER